MKDGRKYSAASVRSTAVSTSSKMYNAAGETVEKQSIYLNNGRKG